MNEPSEPRLELTVDEGVARLHLCRPEVGNAIDAEFCRQFASHVRTLERTEGVRAVLVTAAGRFFSVGGDLKEFRARADGLADHLRRMSLDFHQAVLGLSRLPVPVVAGVKGAAAGGGMSLVCGMDLVVAGRSARFTVAYTRSGLTPDGGGTWFLPRLVGRRRAFDLMATNPTLDADEAAALGIVSRVVDDDEVDDAAAALAGTLAAGATGALGAVKALLDASDRNSLEAQLELESRAITDSGSGPEGREGLEAFLARRTPRFGEVGGG